MFAFYKDHYLTIFMIIFLSIKTLVASDPVFKLDDRPVFVLKKDNKIIYLLGTVHAAPLKSLPEPVLKLLSQASLLMVEHPLTNIPYEFSEQQKLADLTNSLGEALKATGGDTESIIRQTLKKFSTTEKLYTNINTEIQFDFSSLMNYKLWVSDLILSVDLTLKAMTINNGGMESELMKMFQGKTRFLETAQEIYQIMSGSLEQNGKYIERISRTLTTIPKIKAAPQMASFLNLKNYNYSSLKETKDHPLVIGKRNLMWVPKIIEASSNLGEDQAMLVAVGTGHLSGSTGLLKLLSDKGFAISALNSSAQEVAIPSYIKFYD